MNKEIKHLRSMWKARPRRSNDLIVSEVSLKGINGQIRTDNWAYEIPYGMREALDLKFLERKKTEKKGEKPKSYWVWTQGPLLAFKMGDALYNYHSDDRECYTMLQVYSAVSMSWDSEKDRMNEGEVSFRVFERSTQNGQFTMSEAGDYEVSQMDFLIILITGKLPDLTRKEQDIAQADLFA